VLSVSGLLSPRTAALTLLATYHGDRAADALAEVERRYALTHGGDRIARPDRYLSRWSPEQLAGITLRAPAGPTARERCGQCAGSGWIENAAGDVIANCRHETAGPARRLVS
jgi:hypothetical protein